MKILNLILFLIFSLFFGSCDVGNSATVKSQYSATVQPTLSVDENTKPKVDVNSNKTNNENIEEGNEITDCSPQKLYLGDLLKISFKKNHGQNFAIYDEKTKDFYFLTGNGELYFPFISLSEFKERTYINLDTLSVRNPSEELYSDGDNKSKPYFTKPGWYQVIIGYQGLDVDFADMPVTGSCRIYFVNKKRP